MRRIFGLVLCVTMFSFAGAASALEVGKSVEITGEANALWRRIGDWCAITRWHPDIASCEEVHKGLKPSRILTTKNGETYNETLLRKGSMTYTYQINQSPLPVTDFIAMITVMNRSRGKVTITWTANFTEQNGVSANDAKKAVAAYINAGIEGIKQVP